MALTKPPVLPPWAEAGDKVQPSNAEIQAGWPLSNVPPSRQRFNWLLHFLANGVRYMTRRGMPDYGYDETYMIGDRVLGDDGKTYCSTQDNNINHAPSESPLWWEEWAPSLSRLADLLQKQTYTAFTTGGAAPNFTLTPAPAITAYAAGQRFRVKFHAAGSGADVLNVSGLGNKNLKQYNSAGAKVTAVIAGNQLADVEFDGVDMIVIDPLPPSAQPVLPTGAVIYVPQSTAPTGYIKANGVLLSRTAYAALWAHAQSSGNMAPTDAAWQPGMYSPGDGATTFRILDLRGEFIRGWDDGRGIDAGRALGSAQAQDIQSHVHPIATIGGANWSGSDAYNKGVGQSWGAGQTLAAGGTETRPRNVALLLCIKF